MSEHAKSNAERIEEPNTAGRQAATGQQLVLQPDSALLTALEKWKTLRGYGSVEEAALEALRDAMFGTLRNTVKT